MISIIPALLDFLSRIRPVRSKVFALTYNAYNACERILNGFDVIIASSLVAALPKVRKKRLYGAKVLLVVTSISRIDEFSSLADALILSRLDESEDVKGPFLFAEDIDHPSFFRVDD